MGIVCCREEPIDLDGEIELSHFTLLRSIGKGAFGKVRVIQHKGSKKLYALKYINKAKCIQMKAVENIISERRLLEQIDFGLIVNMRYAFQDDDNLFMILDLMLGGDLRFHLDRLGAMPEEYAQFYAAEIALGLHFLHTKDIVHRDLKPDNILLDEMGHAHLTDFNIAAIVDASKPLTAIAGSFAYIAPEILLKRGYTSSVDWWSLGVVLYELLFGKRPFRGKTNELLQQAILDDPITFPNNPKVSKDALDFVKCLLTRDPNSRIGVGDEGFQRLKEHAWFKNISWDKLEYKEVQPPFTPDAKKANFDPTHELEEILLEDNPLRAKKRSPKRSNGVSSYSTSSSHFVDMSALEQSPERQMMEDKFVTFDYSKPDENAHRKRLIEKKQWAQKMNKNTGEKQDFNYNHNPNKKATSTYKATVLDYLNQKPATPLSAGDIIKVQQLNRNAKLNPPKDKATEWRPPSGLMDYNISPNSPIHAEMARDNYLLQNGGVPPPSYPPPSQAVSKNSARHQKIQNDFHSIASIVKINSQKISEDQLNLQHQQPSSPTYYHGRRSSDDSYILASSPMNSEYPLLASVEALNADYNNTNSQNNTYLSSAPSNSDVTTNTTVISNTNVFTPRLSLARTSSLSRLTSKPVLPPTSLPPPPPSQLPPIPLQ